MGSRESMVGLMGAMVWGSVVEGLVGFVFFGGFFRCI